MITIRVTKLIDRRGIIYCVSVHDEHIQYSFHVSELNYQNGTINAAASIPADYI